MKNLLKSRLRDSWTALNSKVSANTRNAQIFKKALDRAEGRSLRHYFLRWSAWNTDNQVIDDTNTIGPARRAHANAER